MTTLTILFYLTVYDNLYVLYSFENCPLPHFILIFQDDHIFKDSNIVPIYDDIMRINICGMGEQYCDFIPHFACGRYI